MDYFFVFFGWIHNWVLATGVVGGGYMIACLLEIYTVALYCILVNLLLRAIGYTLAPFLIQALLDQNAPRDNSTEVQESWQDLQ